MKKLKSGHERSIDASFEEFHLRNPRVYKWLVEQSYLLKRKGYAKFGMKMLWEVLRWDRMTKLVYSKGVDYMLNNNYSSRYARKIMEREAGLKGFFEIRTLRT